jgi:hypothetical protein
MFLQNHTTLFRRALSTVRRRSYGCGNARWRGLVCACFIMSGCVTLTSNEISVDPVQANRLRGTIETIENPSSIDGSYTIIGEYSATSCYSNPMVDEPASPRHALDQLRQFAVDYQGDAILNPSCSTREGSSLKNLCWYSYTCSASIIKYTPEVLEVASLPTTPFETEPVYLGIGFYVSPNGTALTSYQALGGCKAIVDRNDVPYRVLGLDKPNDLALIAPDAPIGVEPLHISTRRSIFSGESVLYPTLLASGSSLDGLAAVRSIVYSNTDPDDNASLMQLPTYDADIISGSPVMDEWGDVIGMTVNLRPSSVSIDVGDSPDAVQLATKKDILLNLLNSFTVDYDQHPRASDRMKQHDITTAIRPSVFPLQCVNKSMMDTVPTITNLVSTSAD